ncbi:hypothetical protein BDY21DRAFT_175914 [Lineolata rhizophorae]|uniref:Uncharacterized protein n=1 Tax=Lineolata rhizophorae TaxID=578093 RepID=A0A6A6NKV2_9PEZI|nr:hypothetical protein BDY21DRAFT_175914 [Lineolata rhizophorae]
METRKVLGVNAISALKEQVRRFESMSVCVASRPDLAMSQAEDIAELTAKLIDVLTKIQRDTQCDTAASRELVRAKIRRLRAQAESRKRKVLDKDALGSWRTITANFRLIFGPPREAEQVSRSTRHARATNLQRVNVIRGLCYHHPHGVIAFSLAHPSKDWVESSREIFNGLVSGIKHETKQAWPEDIVDLMDKLEREMQMSAEFRLLRAAVLEDKHQCRWPVHTFGLQLPPIRVQPQLSGYGPSSTGRYGVFEVHSERRESARPAESRSGSFRPW